MKHRFVILTVMGWCAAPARAQQVLRTVTGAAGDRFGAAAIDVDDQNGDGYRDVLVGSPGFNGGRGAVNCVSGRYLATGALPTVVWSITAPPVNAGAAFGTSLIQVPNLTGSPAPDFVIGAPNYVPTGGFDTRGAIFLVDGATRAIVTFIHGLPQTHFGQTLVSVGDQTGDFKTDIAVSAPDIFTSLSYVHIVPGSAFGFSTALATIPHPSTSGGWKEYGAALASGFDYDGDGRFDLAITSPDYAFANPRAGWVEVRKANTLGLLGGYCPNVTDERFGSSVEVTEDFDGDGVLDLLVGGPGWSAGIVEDGRVVALSGAKFRDPNLPGPLELFTLTLGFSSTVFDLNFGATLRTSDDLNNDGVRDILVGAPSYSTFSGGNFQNKGAVAIFSGATRTRMGIVVGASTDRLGDALVGAVDDFDSDGFQDSVITGSFADANGVDSGVIKACRLFPSSPVAYCTGKVNSLGCTPAMSWSNVASASSATPFFVTCSNVLNQVSGLVFYSNASNTSPFQGGTLCVKSPTRRTPLQNSSGGASGTNCSGAFSYDFNARIQNGIDPTLVVGAEVFCQQWSRDSASPSATSLSNAVRFLINP